MARARPSARELSKNTVSPNAIATTMESARNIQAVAEIAVKAPDPAVASTQTTRIRPPMVERTALTATELSSVMSVLASRLVTAHAIAEPSAARAPSVVSEITRKRGGPDSGPDQPIEILSRRHDSWPLEEGLAESGVGRPLCDGFDCAARQPRRPHSVIKVSGFCLSPGEQVSRLPGERGVLDPATEPNRFAELERGIVPALAEDRDLTPQRVALPQILRRSGGMRSRRRPLDPRERLVIAAQGQERLGDGDGHAHVPAPAVRAKALLHLRDHPLQHGQRLRGLTLAHEVGADVVQRADLDIADLVVPAQLRRFAIELQRGTKVAELLMEPAQAVRNSADIVVGLSLASLGETVAEHRASFRI